jgi:hypothetical protein
MERVFMNRLIITKLYIFSINEKKAKVIPFTKGRNIITSSEIDGTKRGKSIILKSIYHSLGADCIFDGQWDVENKIFILEFIVKEKSYYIFRHGRLFKIYLKDGFKELYKTITREELAEYLKELFDFAVELPNKKDDKLEITPPAYNYLLNYIDQDEMRGTNFSSFKNLQQYSNYKDKVLYYHFNVYTREYYTLIKELEKLKGNHKEYQDERTINQNMLEKINKSIKGTDYSTNIESLKIEVEQYKDEYNTIIDNLNKIKKSLINLRNQKEELISNVKELDVFNNDTEKEVKQIINHICPYCKSRIEDELEVRIQKYNTIEDILFLKQDLEFILINIEKKIKNEESKYRDILEILNVYEEKISINSREINDILKYKGYIELRETIIRELGTITSNLLTIDERLKELNKEKRNYDEAKKKINSRYYELMIKDKERFGLKEIKNKNLLDVSNVFTAGGSNKPIATIMWYINLLKIRDEFNPNAIRFPLVLDSPNNVETDKEKKRELFDYLFSEVSEEVQLIVSSIGFEEKEYSKYKFNNIIKLKNNKYELLNEFEYNENKEFVRSFMNTKMLE